MKASLASLLALVASLLLSACVPAQGQTATSRPATVAAAASPPADTSVSSPAATLVAAPTTDLFTVIATPTPPLSPPASADGDAAVQALLDYFRAINAGDYAGAYSIWAEEGAASGRSFDTFAQGYADTVQVTALLGSPGQAGSGESRSVILPVRLMSVTNLANGEQAVQRYEGAYSLTPAAAGWEIAGASVTEMEPSSDPPEDVADSLVALSSYFDVVNAQGYAPAYTYWGDLGQASGQSFAQFREGFAATQHVDVDTGTPELGGAAGSIYADVAVMIVAKQSDQTVRAFCGTYTLRRANVPPFDQFGWRIYTASIKATASVEPGSNAAKAQLASCP